MTKYFLFLDESGDHGLGKIDPDFPVFVLCGVLMSYEQYLEIGNKVIKMKQKFWPGKKVILHSSDIRKCGKDFKILFDTQLKKEFYADLNETMGTPCYTIMAAAVDKHKYIAKFGPSSDDVYAVSLACILELVVTCIEDVGGSKKLNIVIEKRGMREDTTLLKHFHRLRDIGTGEIPPERFRAVTPAIKFSQKSADIIGLQIADLAAYPIAKYIIDPRRLNPAYDLIAPMFYRRDGITHGLKVLP